MMELLLLKDVEHLGKRGARVTVREGYGRNFLLPTGSAVPATEANIRRVDKVRAQWLAEEATLLAEMKELAGRLAGFSVTIVSKASEAGNLFGSVGVREIALAAAAGGFPLEQRVLRLPTAIKVVGNHACPVVLHDEVRLSIEVRVRAEGRGDWLPGHEDGGAAPAARANG
jgi:large subunit ribosomal protein L9